MRIVTPSTLLTDECIDLTTAKLHARVDIDDEDSWFTANIKAARQWAESYIDGATIPQTFTVYYDSIDVAKFCRAIDLPKRNVISVSSITSYDMDGNATTFDSSKYYLSGDRVALKNNEDWPSDNLRDYDALKIIFSCGFGTFTAPSTWAATIPNDIKQAMLMLIAHWYQNRGDEVAENIIPREIYNFLFPYRRFSL